MTGSFRRHLGFIAPVRTLSLLVLALLDSLLFFSRSLDYWQRERTASINVRRDPSSRGRLLLFRREVRKHWELKLRGLRFLTKLWRIPRLCLCLFNLPSFGFLFSILFFKFYSEAIKAVMIKKRKSVFLMTRIWPGFRSISSLWPLRFVSFQRDLM